MADAPPTPFRVALVSMPWPIVNRPSLQLAGLKSYVEENSAYKVHCFHPYLHIARSIGIDTYTRIARSGWAGEALFAPLLFPEMQPRARRLFQQSIGKKEQENSDYDQLVERIEQSICEWLSATEIDSYKLFGLSVCFFQLLSSLYLATKLKEKNEILPIVFGGSSCTGEIGVSLFKNFRQIDYLISGEGERALLELCHCLGGTKNTLPAGILCRKASVQTAAAAPSIVPNDLPYPDYNPYFLEMQKLFPNQVFIPVLPIEFSRGCWWNRCSFCNLSLQWSNYRCKSSDRMVAETTYLAGTHGCLHFAFADNALPQGEADHFFTGISQTCLDFDFFAEIRGITKEQRLEVYSRGGLSTIQVGIEALSTSLLAKMAKGTSVMDVIAAMKMSSSNGIHLEGNLITEFPGTTTEEIAETLTNLDFVLPFPPLQASSFFLGYGSPMHAKPKKFCIKAILPHSKNQSLFPKKVLSSLVMLANSYRGDRVRQGKIWQPVHEKIIAWQRFHQERKGKDLHPLHYRDGGTFLIICQEQINGPALRHRLKGLSREIYLFCSSPQALPAVRAAFPSVPAPAVEKFLYEMRCKKLMFCENDRFMSLAVRHPSRLCRQLPKQPDLYRS
jgi:ribosomal peptide maturation radical SAM protein 1